MRAIQDGARELLLVVPQGGSFSSTVPARVGQVNMETGKRTLIIKTNGLINYSNSNSTMNLSPHCISIGLGRLGRLGPGIGRLGLGLSCTNPTTSSFRNSEILRPDSV